MAKILAIDSTEQECSIAFANDGHLICSRHENQPRKHAELILPMVQSVLEEVGIAGEQLDAIAITIGPGAFTGVRIGCSIAQGLAFGWQCPLLPIVSLEALAYSAVSETSDHANYLSVFDARLGELYAGLYQTVDGSKSAAILKPIIEPCLLSPKDLNALLRSKLEHHVEPLVCIGSGLVHEAEILADVENKVSCAHPNRQVSAEQVVILGSHQFQRGGIVDPLLLEPKYLRKAVV